MTSGAAGQLYGCACTDRIANGWTPAGIDTAGVTQLGYQTSLLTAVGILYDEGYFAQVVTPDGCGAAAPLGWQLAPLESAGHVGGEPAV